MTTNKCPKCGKAVPITYEYLKENTAWVEEDEYTKGSGFVHGWAKSLVDRLNSCESKDEQMDLIAKEFQKLSKEWDEAVIAFDLGGFYSEKIYGYGPEDLHTPSRLAKMKKWFDDRDLWHMVAHQMMKDSPKGWEKWADELFDMPITYVFDRMEVLSAADEFLEIPENRLPKGFYGFEKAIWDAFSNHVETG